MSFGLNSSGWFGSNNYGSAYTYLYNKTDNIRFLSPNSSNIIDTSLLINKNYIVTNRDIDVNGK